MEELRPFIRGTGGTVVEVGSRDGHDALAMAKMIKADRVVVVEANPVCAEKIMTDYPQFEVYNCAIGDRTGQLDFWQVRQEYGPTMVGQSSLLYKPSYDEMAEKIQVPAFTMDEFTRTTGIESIEVMKIDVEGATYELLNKFTGLRMTRLLHIESEHEQFWDGQKLYEDTAHLLEVAGYEQVYFKPVWTNQSDTIWRRID